MYNPATHNSNERENFIINDEDKTFNENKNTGKDFDDDDNWNECDDKSINPGSRYLF